MRCRIAMAALALGVPSSAFADVVIQSRSSSLHDSSHPGFPLQNLGYNDEVSENQIGQIGSGTLDLATFHGTHFISTASPSLISASMYGGVSSGSATSGGGGSASSTWFAVLFEVTQNAAAMSLTIQNGSILPYGFGDHSDFSLTVADFPSGTVVFDLSRDLHRPDGLAASWNNATWSGLLNPGTYLLICNVNPTSTYSAGGGSGSSGGGNLQFSATFAPPAFPSMAPAPSTAALLSIFPACAFRRRRR